MKRIEAGQRPPLYPRIFSRFPALFQRERKPLLSLPSLTERPFIPESLLFKTVAAELSGTEFHLPERTSVVASSGQIEIAVIASSNSIKSDELKRLVAPYQIVVERVVEAEESHTRDAKQDAMSKAESAAAILQQSEADLRRDVRNRPHVIMATDELNAIPTIRENPETHIPEVVFERVGKPENLRGANQQPLTQDEQLESVRKRFADLVTLARSSNWSSIPYIAELSTVIHNPKDQNTAVSLQKSATFLNRNILEYLATPEGFTKYVALIRELGYDITKIAGGLELDALSQLGAVKYITGTAAEVPIREYGLQREEAVAHARRIALGHADEQLIRAYFTRAEEQAQI